MVLGHGQGIRASGLHCMLEDSATKPHSSGIVTKALGPVKDKNEAKDSLVESGPDLNVLADNAVYQPGQGGGALVRVWGLQFMARSVLRLHREWTFCSRRACAGVIPWNGSFFRMLTRNGFQWARMRARGCTRRTRLGSKTVINEQHPRWPGGPSGLGFSF